MTEAEKQKERDAKYTNKYLVDDPDYLEYKVAPEDIKRDRHGNVKYDKNGVPKCTNKHLTKRKYVSISAQDAALNNRASWSTGLVYILDKTGLGKAIREGKTKDPTKPKTEAEIRAEVMKEVKGDLKQEILDEIKAEQKAKAEAAAKKGAETRAAKKAAAKAKADKKAEDKANAKGPEIKPAADAEKTSPKGENLGSPK